MAKRGAATWTDFLLNPLLDFLTELSDELREEVRRQHAPAPAKAKSQASPKNYHTAEHKREAEQRRILERSWRVLERFGDPLLRKRDQPPSIMAVRSAFRSARHRTHPDRKPGKSGRDFVRVQQAADILGAHLGEKL